MLPWYNDQRKQFLTPFGCDRATANASVGVGTMTSQGAGTARKKHSQQVDMHLERISSPEERRVLAALTDPNRDFRTLEGISKDTGLSEANVKEILDKYPELVRKSAVPDRRGRELYALKSRPVKGLEVLAMMRTFISKSVR